MKTPAWVQLQRANDWGVEYIAYKALNNRGMASARRRILVKGGDKVDILWVDGGQTTETIVMHGRSVTVSDMEHDYKTSYTIPGVEVLHKGVKTWIPLNAEGLKVRNDAFQTEEPND